VTGTRIAKPRADSLCYVIYLKPQLPDGRFNLRELATGLEDGPFEARHLEVTKLDGTPWGFRGHGAPRPLRVTRQVGDVLHLAGPGGGRYEIVPRRRLGSGAL
jgi:hypothetical protein